MNNGIIKKIEKIVCTKELHLLQGHYNTPCCKWYRQYNRNEYNTVNNIVIPGNEYYTGSSIGMTVNCESICK